MSEEAKPGVVPSLGEALGWVGFALDAAGGVSIGRVRGVFVDADSGDPSWLIAELGRRRLLPRRGGKVQVAIPARDCAGGGGRAWAAHEAAALRGAPTVDPRRALLREHELAICAHYGIGESVGRAAEVLGRPEGAVTSRPA